MPRTYKEKIESIVGFPVILRGLSVDTIKSKGGMYQIQKEGEIGLHGIVTRFSLIPMPGCCGIIISTGVYVYPDFRGKGLGTLLNNMRIQMAQDLGYGLIICTDVDSNKPQKRILSKNGWNLVDNFINPRTNHSVNFHTFHVQPTDRTLGFDLRKLPNLSK
jgi:GNAT superfamily N-acetyltransferase